MNLANEIFNIYQELYNESTDEFWNNHAERLGVSIDILRSIFEPKEDERDKLVEFVHDFLSDKILLRELLNNYDERNVDIVDIESIRITFLGILGTIEQDDIQEILDDDEVYEFSIGLCEGVLIALEDALLQMFQEGY